MVSEETEMAFPENSKSGVSYERTLEPPSSESLENLVTLVGLVPQLLNPNLREIELSKQ